MRRPRIHRDEQGTVWVERFTRIRRTEHLLAIVTFFTLVLTGFPQKFFDAQWAQWTISAMGGLPMTRFIHRVAGWVFSIHAVLHLAIIVLELMRGRGRMTLLPTPSDLRDLWQTISYDLGFRSRPPALPKFDYRQKFEYVGLVLGGLVMVVSGLILFDPGLAATIFPGEWIPAARVAHTNEAVLALLVLMVWHIYGAVLSPRVFPLDKVILTGQMSAAELRHHHAREYRALFGDVAPDEIGTDIAPWPRSSRSDDVGAVPDPHPR